MLVYGDRIVTGVSGGADSMCLLHFLVSHAESFSAEIIAAHVNHNLRGDEAMRDQKLVEKYCASLGIKCEVLSADINSISEKNGESCEECGRRIRYEFFERLCGEKGKIATAHTLSDSAETVIFNTVRGTGLKGLTGIPKNPGKHNTPPNRNNTLAGRRILQGKRHKLCNRFNQSSKTIITETRYAI
jgi:tRNA(Ile)-lysidine synthetase, N-terminal domain